MTQLPLPKPVFVKRKKASKRRRRTEIPSPPHSPDAQTESAVQLPSDSRASGASSRQRALPSEAQPLRRPVGRIMQAQNLPIAPVIAEVTPSVDYSAQALQRMREAQSSRPPPSSVTKSQAVAGVPPREIEPRLHAKPEIQTVDSTARSSGSLSVNQARIAAQTPKPAVSARAAPFTAAWNPTVPSDDIAIEDEPDLSSLAVQEGSHSSDDGWEAAQLARGGGQVTEQDYRQVIRHTEETMPTKGNLDRLRATLKAARKEWEGRELAAGESANRAARAAENAGELMKDANENIRECEETVGSYENVVQVFRRACACLGKEKDAILGYREKVLESLEQEAEQVRVRLLGGEDEFGRSVPGKLTDLSEDGDDEVVMEGDETVGADVGFDVEGMIDEVISALDKWKETDEDGYAKGFGAQGGGRVIGRLGLALPRATWLTNLHDVDVKEAAAKTGEVKNLAIAEILARWEPRRSNGFKEWDSIIHDEELVDAVRKRLGWEIEACVKHGDSDEAELCVNGALEVGRLGIDLDWKVLDKLRGLLGEANCSWMEEEMNKVMESHAEHG